MNNIDLLVDLFNKLIQECDKKEIQCNFNDLIIYKNIPGTWELFNQTNGEEEVATAKRESIEFDPNLPYLVVVYDAYFKSMSEAHVVEFIKEKMSLLPMVILLNSQI